MLLSPFPLPEGEGKCEELIEGLLLAVTPDMPKETLSEKIARDCTELEFVQIPNDVIEAAKLHILDSLGCLFAGTRLEPGRLAYELAIAMSGISSEARSTLFGTTERVSYLDAVQAMSVAAHCGEIDDIHAGAGTCIGAIVVPALLTMAEKFGGSGRRFLEATVVGYETVIRVGLSINTPQLFARGWWPSTVCGAFGVAAAGAKFLGWPADQMANALGIASLHAGGMITGGGEGATARHLVFGRAAQSGGLALLAAEKGFTGPIRAFDDQRGFCLTLCNEPHWKYLQGAPRFELPGVAFKPYPCARQLHAGVEALLKIIQRHSPAPELIDEIKLSLPTQNAGMVDRPSITGTHAATVGSGQYIMATTLLRGKIDLLSFDAEFLNSEAVRKLMTKVEVTGSSDLDRHFPKYWSGRVTVKAGGKIYSEAVIIPKGEIGNPMARDELEQKFLSLATPIIGHSQARAVIADIGSLDRRDSLEPLISSLRLSS
jgi:2-methylcitrate dehydratase PrpD